MFVIVVEDITSHHTSLQIQVIQMYVLLKSGKMCKFKHDSKSTHYFFEEESTTLPEAEKNADSYSLLFTMTRGNVITESQKTSLSMHILLK